MTDKKDLSDSEVERLLRQRKRGQKEFTRDQAWRFKRVKKGWRRPKGIHNKVRKEVKGRRAKVKVGYRSPKAVRFLHPSGKRERRVSKLEDLYNINPKREVVRIEGSVGRRKRREIVDFAQKYGIKILNPGVVGGPELPAGAEEVLPGEEELFEEDMFEEESEELFEEETERETQTEEGEVEEELFEEESEELFEEETERETQTEEDLEEESNG